MRRVLLLLLVPWFAVADGRVVNGVFMAEEVLAKHDEKYMPAEIDDRVKEAARKAAES